MSSTITMRPAKPGDVLRIAALSRDEIEAGLAWTWHARRVAQTLSRKDVLGVVAVADDRVVGFCLASYGDRTAHVLLLAVAPSARRQGLGGRLLGWHLRCMRVAGVEKVRLEVRASRPGAIRFYESEGFEALARVRRYYQGREDAVRMQLLLS